MKEENLLLAVQLWRESRGLSVGTVAEVTACVVPVSGVGWIDLTWRRQLGPLLGGGGQSRWPEKKRIVGDWDGQSQSAVTRQIVSLADDWFAYCEEQARQEAVVLALA